MKISIGTNIKEGPWGGGNLFAINLSRQLVSQGHKVFFNLTEEDLDLILITEPRRTSESSAFTDNDVKKYLSYVNPNCVVVHRINECDERKQTNFVNKYLIYANLVADSTIFVSTWLKKLFLEQNLNSPNINVIMAGADSSIFNSLGYKKWDKKNKLKIITHHWGANWNKGFDTYKLLDDLLDKKIYKERFEFEYIGNLPKDFKFKNTNVIKPLSGKKLAKKIKESHVYLTGSLNEPSGNHHIEAAQCGLPIIYINSGGIPEYCKGFGIEFDNASFEHQLNNIYQSYDLYESKMKSYPYNAEIMCNDYISLFEKLISNREEIVKARGNDLYYDSYIQRLVYLNSRKIMNR
jgi:glycosyltransferase involved in cell wall biosynthesis